MKESFTTSHPVILFSYFIAVIFCTMFFNDPLSRGISLLCGVAVILFIKQVDKETLKKRVKLWFSILLFSSLANFLFVHSGRTILFVFFEKRFTVEALFYGFSFGLFILSIMTWFNVGTLLIGTSQINYLLKKRLPKTGLIFSLVSRFIPLYKEEWDQMKTIHRTLGYTQKTKSKEILVSQWTQLLSRFLKRSVILADSLDRKGYGSKKATHYVTFRWRKIDSFLLSIFFILAVVSIWFYLVTGWNLFYYYPTTRYVHSFFDVLIGESFLILFYSLPIWYSLGESS